jgi:hypothetical protein
MTDDKGSQEQWRRERDFLNARRHDLARSAQHRYPPSWRVAGTPMLARPDWIPAAPVPLDQVTLSWRPGGDAAPPSGGPLPDGTGPESAAVRPWRDDGRRFSSYAAALGALTRPVLFENRACYRLLGVRTAPGATSLEFGPGRYFEMINTGEAVAHEYAAAALAAASPAGDPVADGTRASPAGGPVADGTRASPAGGPVADGTRASPAGDPAADDARASPAPHPAAGELPLRSLIGDPTDLRRRPVMAAVATLVLRADRAGGDTQMILHWRDPARVATGGGLYQVAPVGMFQPSHDAAWNLANDFSLWRAIVRELAEELLGAGEDYHSDAAPIDYQRWPLYAALADARHAGSLRAHWLGLGVDPLTLVVDMLTVAVFDAPVFDAVFAGLVSANAEGRIVTGEDATGTTIGIPFRAATVERFTTAEPMQAAGAALLRLAWRHRDALLRR